MTCTRHGGNDDGMVLCKFCDAEIVEKNAPSPRATWGRNELADIIESTRRSSTYQGGGQAHPVCLEDKYWAMICEALRAERVAAYILEAGQEQLGAGDDPVGFLMASHAFLADMLNEAKRLLQRIREWDMMEHAADGRYWAAEIDKVVTRRPEQQPTELEMFDALISGKATVRDLCRYVDRIDRNAAPQVPVPEAGSKDVGARPQGESAELPAVAAPVSTVSETGEKGHRCPSCGTAMVDVPFEPIEPWCKVCKGDAGVCHRTHHTVCEATKDLHAPRSAIGEKTVPLGGQHRVITDDDPSPYDLSDNRHPANRRKR